MEDQDPIFVHVTIRNTVGTLGDGTAGDTRWRKKLAHRRERQRVRLAIIRDLKQGGDFEKVFAVDHDNIFDYMDQW